MSVIVERLAIIGVGLIGGSFGLALKEAGAVDFVYGYGRTRENLQDALAAGAIDDASTEIDDLLREADVVLLAVPVRAMAQIVKDIAYLLKPGCIVTDAGSTKEVVLGEMVALLPSYVHVVPGHPIAGSEKTGAAAALADLYRGRRTILTPGPGTDREAVEVVKKLWEAVGANVEIMDPSIHDMVLGAVSHLPHMVAYALVDTVMKWDEEQPMLRFSAGGLRDFTRIASSSEEMWADICVDNSHKILQAINRFQDSLEGLKKEVDAQDRKALIKRFELARKVRRKITDGGDG